MKYYVSLVITFLVLCFVELFLSRLIPNLNFSFILVFLLTAAFFAPTKARYAYRSLIPISVICGLAVDGMSALPTGVVFIVYFVASLLVLNIAKRLPQSEDLRFLAIIIFCTVFVLRIILSLVFNYANFLAVEKDIFSAFISAIVSSLLGLFFAFLMETKNGTTVVKILFSED